MLTSKTPSRNKQKPKFLGTESLTAALRMFESSSSCGCLVDQLASCGWPVAVHFDFGTGEEIGTYSNCARTLALLSSECLSVSGKL